MPFDNLESLYIRAELARQAITELTRAESISELYGYSEYSDAPEFQPNEIGSAI